MKAKHLIILILLLHTISLYSQQDKIKITGEFRNISFEQFRSAIEAEYGVIFYYNREWTDSLLIDYGCDNKSLELVLTDILGEKDINFILSNPKSVILTGNTKVLTRMTQVVPDNKNIYSSDNESVPVKAKGQYELIEIGTPVSNMKGNVNLSGYVRNTETGEPVIGAVFKIEELKIGTMTNQYGFYSLAIPKGRYKAEFSCLGMKSLIQNIGIYSDGTLNVEMKENLIPLGSVIITAERGSALFRTEAGLDKIDVKTIRLIPTSMGEPDLIKTTLFLPGVQTIGEGSSGFHVRGGASDQNLVLLYDVPLFNTSHFFGFFSAVNSNVIGDISLFKGGIPARYGGKVSSVLHIIPKDGNKKELSGNGGISPVTSHLLIEGPIIKDKTSFLVAGRTTYSNWVLRLLDDPQLRNSSASFYDVNVRLVHEADKNNNLEISSYLSHDAFKFNTDTLYSYNNNLFSIKWRHIFSNKLFGVIAVNNSNYNYSITSNKDIFTAFDLRHRVNYSEIKSQFTYYPNNNHQIEAGLDIAKYMVTPGELIPQGDSSLIVVDIVNKQRAVSPSLYISDEIRVIENLTFYAGLRLSAFVATGPATVFRYHPDYTRSLSSVTDTVNYGKGKIVKSYFSPELRLALNYRIGQNNSVKVNYNNTTQYIHQISNSTAISPTDIWVLSDSYLKPVKGNQVAIGFFTSLLHRKLEITLEAYYKEINNMIDFKGGSRLLLNHNLEKDIVNVFGIAKGIEFMAKKTNGRLNGWVSYSYSRINIRSIANFPEEEINDGEFFPATFDKPHDVSVVFNYAFSRRLSISSTYTYSTGRPITYPVAAYTFGGSNILHYSERNQYRIPDYSRLDFSATIDGNLKSKKLAHSTFTFSVFNLLGRDNVYSIYFKTKHNLVNGYKLSIFARPIPSISYNFKF